MRPVQPLELGRETVKTLHSVDSQITAVAAEAKTLDVELDVLRDSHGGFVMIPLLAARAQLLHTLALINDGKRKEKR